MYCRRPSCEWWGRLRSDTVCSVRSPCAPYLRTRGFLRTVIFVGLIRGSIACASQPRVLPRLLTSTLISFGAVPRCLPVASHLNRPPPPLIPC